MSLKFKTFANEPFKAVLEKVVKQDFSEPVRMKIWRFKNKYNVEIGIFIERLKELQKKAQDELQLVTEAEKEEREKALNSEFMKSLEELLECESELKPLDYATIKDCTFSPLEMDILEQILSNIPEE